MRGGWRHFAGLARGAVLAVTVAAAAQGEERPRDYQQILPRGRIAAIEAPRFVPASKARVPGDAWVLGVVVNGEARAYSLNLLNRHEVVNDRAGGTSFAVVWCPLANAGVVYGRDYGGRELRFEASGGLVNSALVMRDRETGSYWPIITGAAATGKLKGTPLEALPVGVKTTWKDWVRQHPDTAVLSVGGVEYIQNNPYDQYFASDSGFREASAKDKRLPTKEPVWAFELEGRRFAVPFRAFEGGAVFHVGERWIFLYRPKGAPIYASTRALVSEGRIRRIDDGWVHEPSGGRFDSARGSFGGAGAGNPRAFAGLDTFWYVWSLTHPQTEILPASTSR